jgi:hypothetical protein
MDDEARWAKFRHMHEKVAWKCRVGKAANGSGQKWPARWQARRRAHGALLKVSSAHPTKYSAESARNRAADRCDGAIELLIYADKDLDGAAHFRATCRYSARGYKANWVKGCYGPHPHCASTRLA